MPDTGHAPTASLDHRMISVTDVYFALNKSSKRAVGYDTAAFFIAVQVWHRQQKILPLSSWIHSIFYYEGHIVLNLRGRYDGITRKSTAGCIIAEGDFLIM